MAELDEISRAQGHFSPHFILIYLMRALAILCKLGVTHYGDSTRAKKQPGVV